MAESTNTRRRKQEMFLMFERWGFDTRGWLPNTRYLYARKVRAADAWLEQHRGTSLLWAKPKDLQAYLFSTSPTAGNRNNIRQALVAFGAFLMDQGWTEVNHALALPRLPVPSPVPKALDDEQCRRILVMARTLPAMQRALILVYLYGGVRKSEGRLLTWAQVSEDCEWLRIKGKGGREREVSLGAEAQSALAGLRALGLDPQWVFPSPLRPGHPVGETWVRSVIVEVGELAGIPRLHCHLFRHSAATMLLKAGVDLRTVQDYLGHADLSSTQVYLRVQPSDLHDAGRRLSSVLTTQPHSIEDAPPGAGGGGGSPQVLG